MGPARMGPGAVPMDGRAAARVRFDAAARHLLTTQAGDEYLNVRFTGTAPPIGLSLHVSPSVELGAVLMVFGEPGRVLRAHCTAVPAAIAAVLVACGETTGRRVRCGFLWSPGVVRSTMAVLGFGLAARVRTLVRFAEPDPGRRPVIHLEDRSS